MVGVWPAVWPHVGHRDQGPTLPNLNQDEYHWLRVTRTYFPLPYKLAIHNISPVNEALSNQLVSQATVFMFAIRRSAGGGTGRSMCGILPPCSTAITSPSRTVHGQRP